MDLIVELKEKLAAAIPRKKDFFETTINQMDKRMRESLRAYLRVSLQSGKAVDNLVEDYVFTLREINEEQVAFFRRRCRYRHESGEEIRERVYRDDVYMERYMTGLALSAFLWPQHIDIYYFFRNQLDELKFSQGSSYLEIGAGCGLMSREALISNVCSSYTFVDISEKSLCLTQQMVESLFDVDKASDVKFSCSDFMRLDEEKHYNVIVANGVIQALEKSSPFLDKCCSLLVSEGIFFLTASLNSPMPDVIRQFSSADELESLLKCAGFNIEKSLQLPYENRTMEECEIGKFPINLAYWVKKQKE